MTVLCPACPLPNVNFDPKDLPSADSPNWYLFNITRSIDGNFQLHAKKKASDASNTQLITSAYFPDPQAYQDHLANASNTAEKSTCSSLNALVVQNPSKFQHMSVSGVITSKCSQHDFFLHSSLADLQCGERYVNADFILASSLQKYDHHPYILITYNIVCQYAKKIVDQFKQHFPKLTEAVVLARMAIGKMHMQAHKEDYQYNYALQYTLGAGCLGGKMIETGWAEHNKITTITHKMAAGFRHDKINNHVGNDCWQKSANMENTLERQYKMAVIQAAWKKVFFDGCTKLNINNVTEWQENASTFTTNGGDRESVYKLKQVKFPTQSAILQSLLATEHQDETTKHSPHSPATFVNDAIKILTRQLKLVHHIENLAKESDEKAHDAIDTERRLLFTDIGTWRLHQLQHMPSLQGTLPECRTEDETEPEGTCLYLPSDFTTKEWCSLGIEDLANIKLKLREGVANDTKRHLHTQINLKNSLLSQKRIHSRGTKDNTHVLKVVQDAEKEKRFLATLYCAMREAIVALGGDGEKAYPPLTEQDMVVKSQGEGRAAGTGKETDSWLFCSNFVHTPDSGSLANWEIETNRIQWFCAKAELDRWNEEVCILKAEFACTACTFEFLSNAWAQSVKGPIGNKRGYSTFASERSNMYTHMVCNCSEKFNKLSSEYTNKPLDSIEEEHIDEDPISDVEDGECNEDDASSSPAK